MKKIALRSLSLLSVFIVTAAIVTTVISRDSQPAHADSTSSLSGYAWSDTIGWISFSGSGYGVTEDVSGNLKGYAWSDNIGWIKFGGLTGFPSGGSTNANASIDSSGVMHGWARACAGTVGGDCSSMTSRTDGWDGWISFDGPNYGIQFGTGNSQYGGSAYAWGSDVVGWINFNPAGLSIGTNPTCDPAKEVCSNGSSLVPSVALYITGSNGAPGAAASINQGSSATLNWTTSNVTTCTGSASGVVTDNTWNPSAAGFATSSGHQSTAIINTPGTETYTLSCTANAQTGPLANTQIPSTPASVTLTINSTVIATTTPPGNPTNNSTSTCPAINNATMCAGSGGSTSGIVSMCPVSASICEWTCNAGYRQVGNQCVSNGTIQEQ